MSVFQHGKVELIANDKRNWTIPSYVAFTDADRLIADAVNNQIAVNPTDMVFDVKHLTGHSFDDAVV